jgi:hypothetical protein
MNFKDINNTFFDLENKYSLFDKKISGIFFWELLRFDISRKILIKK